MEEINLATLQRENKSRRILKTENVEARNSFEQFGLVRQLLKTDFFRKNLRNLVLESRRHSKHLCFKLTRDINYEKMCN